MSLPLPPASPPPPTYCPLGDDGFMLPRNDKGCCVDPSGETDNFQVIFGIVIHIIGSIGINTGQNMQAMGLSTLPEEDRKAFSKLRKNRMWAIGCTMFVTCSMVNFAALTLAPAMILVPLEAVQFVNNVAFGKFVRKVPIPAKMMLGVVCMILGVTCAVLFGERSSHCFDMWKLMEFWEPTNAWGWWLYIIITFSISAFCLVAHSRLWPKRKEVANGHIILPILYSMPSALLGGGQMIVQSKCLSELAEITFTPKVPGDDRPLPIAHWFFWVELVLVSSFGIFWFFRLTESLGMYDPLFIIPLMQANFIVWGGIAGGIFFQEFKYLSDNPPLYAGNWAAYIFGVVLVVLGLYLVAPTAGDEAAGGGESSATPPARSAASNGDANGQSLEGASGRAVSARKLPSAISSNVVEAISAKPIEVLPDGEIQEITASSVHSEPKQS